MIKILEDNKEIIIGKDKIICRSYIKTSFVKSSDSDVLNDTSTKCRIYFEGVAHLREGDKSNVLEATRIAEDKMERKYYKYIRSYKKRLLKNTLIRYSEIINDIIDAEKNLERIDTHIEEICKRL